MSQFVRSSMRLKRSIAFLSTMLIASSVLLASGCGRSPIDPLGPDEPGAEVPGGDDDLPFPDDPGYDDPWPMPDPGEPGGGFTPVDPPTSNPQPAPGGGGQAPVMPRLKPISKPTPPPAPKAGDGGGADPEEAVSQFLDVLSRFNYQTDRHDVRMQMLPLTRVPGDRFKWNPDPKLGLVFGNRKRNFPGDISYDQWKEAGLSLARRNAPVTFYVARGPLYREIMSNWYQRPNPRELVFYKRLNNTPYMVSYRPDGTVMDYGAFPEIDWRTFIEVPQAIWK